MRLRDIPLTCPIFDRLTCEIDDIRKILGEKVSDLIEAELKAIKDYADEIRNTAADLRECAKEIADSKDEDISELNSEIQDLKDQLLD